MASSADQTVRDFDLNFLDASLGAAENNKEQNANGELQENPLEAENQSNPLEAVNLFGDIDQLLVHMPMGKYQKHRTASISLKQKIIQTKALITKFYEKKSLLEIAEQQLLAAKEECRQISIQFKDSEDRNTHLQTENTKLQNANRELQAKVLEAENQCGAMKSHCNQLQILAKENVTKYESLRLERNLEKNEDKVNVKKATTLEKEKSELVKLIITLGEVVLGTRTANKNDRCLLAKYKIPSAKLGTPEDDATSDCDVFEDAPTSPAYDTEDKILSPDMLLICQNTKESGPAEVDRDWDSGTEVVSEDTGRGSSLASSGSDKCFSSPEYFITTSTIGLLDDNQKKPALVDGATSPIPSQHKSTSTSPVQIDTVHASTKTQTPLNVDVGTSPMKTRRLSHKSTSPAVFESQNKSIKSIFDLPEELESPKKQSRDIATSPILPVITVTSVDNVTVNDSLPALSNADVPVNHCLTKLSNDDVPVNHCLPTLSSDDVPVNHRLPTLSNDDVPVNHCLPTLPDDGVPVNHCLSTLSSDESDDEEHTREDSEIEMIFTNMRLTHSLVTPIPTTPKSTRASVARCGSAAINVHNELSRNICPEAAKIRAENTVLHTKLSDLTKEVMNIKSLLIDTLKTGKTGNISRAIQFNDESTALEEPHNQETKASEKDGGILQLPEENGGKYAHNKNTQSTESVLKIQEDRPIDYDGKTGNTSRAIQFNDEGTTLGEPQNKQKMASEKDGGILQLPEENGDCKDAQTKNTHSTESVLKIQKDSLMDYDDVVTIVILEENNRSNSAKGLASEDEQFDDALCVTNTPASKVSEESYNTNGETNDLFKKPSDPAIKNNARAEVPMRRMSQAISFEQELDEYDSAAEDTSEPNIEQLKMSPATDNIITTIISPATKARKLTKLERLRKKLVPKSKIKRVAPPTKRRGKRIAPKKLHDNASSKLNNKAAYEKAVKIMSELRKSQKVKTIVTNINRMKVGKPLTSVGDKIKANNNDRIETVEPKEIIIPNESTDADQNKNLRTSDNNVSESKSKPHNNNKYNNNKVNHTTQNNNNNRINNKSNEAISDSPKFTKQNRNLKNSEDGNQLNAIPIQSDEDNLPVDSETRKCTRTTPIPIKTVQRSQDDSPESNRSSSRIATQNRSAKNKGESNDEEMKKNEHVDDKTIKNSSKIARENRKRSSVDSQEPNKRILRSSCGAVNSDKPVPVVVRVNIEKDSRLDRMATRRKEKTYISLDAQVCKEPEKLDISERTKTNSLKTYNDIDLFSDANTDAVDNVVTPKKKQKVTDSRNIENPHESILCAMLDKYSVAKLKSNPPKLPSDTVTTPIKQKIEKTIDQIVDLPPEKAKAAMNKFVKEITEWPIKDFTCGFLKYLGDPTRKTELLNKRYVMNSPEMTKPEQVLLYVVDHLKNAWPNVNYISYLMDSIEYTLFRLNKTPEFETIESMGHLYAVLCRYSGAKTRLRMFMMDAMYCLQYKAVPLIRQSIDVWMHVLPLAHLGIAKSPLVTCLVYLLHFYKCEDRFNRVQDIRNILNRKYAYQVTEWNEPKLLEMVRNAVKDQKNIKIEKKMLRMALIILAKRHGPRWCQKHIVNGILLPMIDQDNVSEKVKQFCMSMLGPLMRPYPLDMTVNVEVVINQLLDRLDRNLSPEMQEATFESLIYMSKHSFTRVLQALLKWHPERLSPGMEGLLRDFVQAKPIKAWQHTLSKISLAPF